MHRSHKERLYSGLWYYSIIEDKLCNSRYPFKKVHERIGFLRRLRFAYIQAGYMRTGGEDRGSRVMAIILNCVIRTINEIHIEYLWMISQNTNSSSKSRQERP